MITYCIIFISVYFTAYTSICYILSENVTNYYLETFLFHCVSIYITSGVAGLIWRQKCVPKMRVSPKNKAVFVTGCDTGFGNLLARKLDQNGYKVLAGCLFPEADNAKTLVRQTSNELKLIKLDVTNDKQVYQAVLDVAKSLGTHYELLAVVNNAGILATGEVEFGTGVAPFERQLNVNCLGTIRVTKAFCPLLRRCTSSPRLVNVTSLAASISLPGLVGYCVSKSAVHSFTNGVRIELAKWGINTVSIEPHLFNTNLVARDAQRKGLENLWLTSNPVTRYDYGETFFTGAQKLLEYGSNSARDNIPDVVQALYDSVTLKYPEQSRKICSSFLELFRVWFMLTILPSFVQSLLLSWGASWITGKPYLLTNEADKSINTVIALNEDYSSEKNFDNDIDVNGNNNETDLIRSKLRSRIKNNL